MSLCRNKLEESLNCPEEASSTNLSAIDSSSSVVASSASPWTPDAILNLTGITEDYLCNALDNVYNIDFTRFKIRDLETDLVLFEIAKPPSEQFRTTTATKDVLLGDQQRQQQQQLDGGGSLLLDPNSGRYVRYQFTPQFLRLKTVGAT